MAIDALKTFRRTKTLATLEHVDTSLTVLRQLIDAPPPGRSAAPLAPIRREVEAIQKRVQQGRDKIATMEVA